MTDRLTLTVPSSKSLTQRALLVAALGEGESAIHGALDCDDSRHLRRALRACGVSIEDGADPWRVLGGTLRLPPEPVFCGNAGTTLRFLAALPLVADGALTLDGDTRMRQRPIGALTAALSRLGVDASFGGAGGYPPVTLRRTGAPRGSVRVDARESSQFASALMMVAPLLPRGLRLNIPPDTVSRPYLSLTAGTMSDFGAAATFAGGETILVPAGSYRPSSVTVEGDWSSAAFLLAAARITGKKVVIGNAPRRSRQGDRAIVEILRELRRPRRHEVDLRATPDLVAPVAAAALFAADPTVIKGVAHARRKESDRLRVLAAELGKLGADIRERRDGLVVRPAPLAGPALLDPAADHRMAMAFGLVSLRVEGVEVADRGCVTKSFPGFWKVLEELR